MLGITQSFNLSFTDMSKVFTEQILTEMEMRFSKENDLWELMHSGGGGSGGSGGSGRDWVVLNFSEKT